jgi:hypothetical protein
LKAANSLELRIGACNTVCNENFGQQIEIFSFWHVWGILDPVFIAIIAKRETLRTGV